jgi:hypothetical protein
VQAGKAERAQYRRSAAYVRDVILQAENAKAFEFGDRRWRNSRHSLSCWHSLHSGVATAPGNGVRNKPRARKGLGEAKFACSAVHVSHGADINDQPGNPHQTVCQRGAAAMRVPCVLGTRARSGAVCVEVQPSRRWLLTFGTGLREALG